MQQNSLSLPRLKQINQFLKEMQMEIVFYLLNNISYRDGSKVLMLLYRGASQITRFAKFKRVVFFPSDFDY